MHPFVRIEDCTQYSNNFFPKDKAGHNASYKICEFKREVEKNKRDQIIKKHESDAKFKQLNRTQFENAKDGNYTKLQTTEFLYDTSAKDSGLREKLACVETWKRVNQDDQADQYSYKPKLYTQQERNTFYAELKNKNKNKVFLDVEVDFKDSIPFDKIKSNTILTQEWRKVGSKKTWKNVLTDSFENLTNVTDSGSNIRDTSAAIVLTKDKDHSLQKHRKYKKENKTIITCAIKNTKDKDKSDDLLTTPDSSFWIEEHFFFKKYNKNHYRMKHNLWINSVEFNDMVKLENAYGFDKCKLSGGNFEDVIKEIKQAKVNANGGE